MPAPFVDARSLRDAQAHKSKAGQSRKATGKVAGGGSFLATPANARGR